MPAICRRESLRTVRVEARNRRMRENVRIIVREITEVHRIL